MPAYTSRLRRAVHARLSGLAPVVAVVGTRIYPARPAQGWDPSAGPCLLHDVGDMDVETDLDGNTSTGDARVDLLAVASTLAVAESLQRLLLKQFPGSGLVAAGVTLDAVLADGEGQTNTLRPDGTDSILYTVTQRFTVLFQTS
jgi:hypothetical protein